MPHASDNLWLHRYAVLTAGATFFLIIAGALVTSNDAGLAVPDWPLSYGRLMPPMVGGIFYEHGHRMVAATVGLLTIGLAIWLSLGEPRRWVRRLGWAALGLVIAQGILGGITVLYFLPPAVSIAHACLAQLFFCCTVSLAVFTSPGYISTQPAQRATEFSPGCEPWVCGTKSLRAPEGAKEMRPSVNADFLPPLRGSSIRGSIPRAHALGYILSRLRRSTCGEESAVGMPVPLFYLAVATAAAVYCQLILGAAVRHSVLGVLPHLLWAPVVVALGFATTACVFRRHAELPGLRRPAALLSVMLLAQIFLGLGSYVVKYMRQEVQPLPLAVAVTTAHVALGAVLLAVSLVLALRAYRLLHAHAGDEVGALLAPAPGSDSVAAKPVAGPGPGLAAPAK